MIERKFMSGTMGSILLARPEDVPSVANSMLGERDLTPRIFRGTVGHIRWHYYVAAEVHGYTVVPRDEQWTLTAQLVAQDAFKMSQRPLRFAAMAVKGRDLGGGVYGTKTEWRWPLVSFALAEGGRLTATLGALEP